jgi:uncharacterized protein (TIGR03435 family)
MVQCLGRPSCCGGTRRFPPCIGGLGRAGSLALLAIFPICCASAQQTSVPQSTRQLSFEVATVRPSKPGRWGQDLDQSGDRLTVQNYTVRRLIREAYGLKSDSQIIGGPGWIDDRRFDIIAKVDDAEAARMSKMTGEQSDKEWALMLQSLLADRFQLRVTREERTLPVYALIVARSGPKIKRAPEHRADSQDGDPGIEIDWSELTARAASMEAFADSLTSLRDLSSRVVLNRTGLVGDYDFKLDWARDRGDGASQDSPYPALFEALPEQLGLRLKAERAAVEVVIVEAAKAPTGN